MLQYANAFPRKRFFLEMFTRDISVEDCVLDLIDNSMDALIRTRKIDIRSLVLRPRPVAKATERLPLVTLSHSASEMAVVDLCGGIPLDYVSDEVFSFGHTTGYKPGALGAYGVGLKRALFKLGRRFELRSRTVKGGFDVDLDVDEWSREDARPDDWRIPVRFTERAARLEEAGTTIRIRQLRAEVQQRLSDPKVENRLERGIAQAYALFLERHVRILLNRRVVRPYPLPLGQSRQVKPGVGCFEEDGVTVTLVASLAPRDDQRAWTQEGAGWYVFCNGRLVVAADKTETTGWGDLLPQWHAKYNGFLGIALCDAANPLALPWTTTKRDLNRESQVYQLARERMAALGKPVTSFLNRMYPSEPEATPSGRRVVETVRPVGIASVASRNPSAFRVNRESGAADKTTVRIQYDAEKRDVERIRKRLGKPRMSASLIGKHTFDHFVRRECPE